MSRATTAALFLSILAGCRAPGGDIAPREGDFAFIEVNLRG